MTEKNLNNLPPIGKYPSISEKKLVAKLFPKLKDNEWKKTGSSTNPGPDNYNCIAWSLCRSDIGWVWYQIDKLCNDNNIVEIEDFDCFYEQYDLKISENNGKNFHPQCKMRKVVLFSKDGIPTHAAKEIADGGWWESKLGREIRIIHRLEQLEGDEYGKVCRCYLKEDKSANLNLCN